MEALLVPKFVYKYLILMHKYFHIDLIQIAEQLMIMHEDCLQGNYESIEKQKLIHVKHAVSQIRPVN